MELEVKEEQTVLETRKAFQKMFDGLKIEFFQKSHEEGESSNVGGRWLGTTAMIDIVNCDLPFTITLSKDMTVAEVEAAWERTAGVHTQVFRNMHGLWIETVQTDNYTLEKQMELSKNSISV